LTSIGLPYNSITAIVVLFILIMPRTADETKSFTADSPAVAEISARLDACDVDGMRQVIGGLSMLVVRN